MFFYNIYKKNDHDKLNTIIIIIIVTIIIITLANIYNFVKTGL